MKDMGYPCIWCYARRYHICDGDERCKPYKKWADKARREYARWYTYYDE